MGAKRSRIEPEVFAAEDPYRNIVRLERSTWERHIIQKHQEMAGSEESVKKVVQAPDIIRESTLDRDCVAFENATLRVLALYETTGFAKGLSFGKVTTAYPKGSSGKANVGTVIYRKGDKL